MRNGATDSEQLPGETVCNYKRAAGRCLERACRLRETFPRRERPATKNRTNISDRQLLHRSVWRSSKEHLISKARTLSPPVTVSGGFKKSIQRVSGAALTTINDAVTQAGQEEGSSALSSACRETPQQVRRVFWDGGLAACQAVCHVQR